MMMVFFVDSLVVKTGDPLGDLHLVYYYCVVQCEKGTTA